MAESLPTDLMLAASRVKNRMQELSEDVAAFTAKLDKFKPGTAARTARCLMLVESIWEPLTEQAKSLGALVNTYRVSKVPDAMMAEGVKTITLEWAAQSYRVTVNQLYRASVQEGKKDEAIAWMNKNGYKDIPQVTINASTLSAFAKTYAEDKGKDLPSTIFKVGQVPNTSITRIK